MHAYLTAKFSGDDNEEIITQLCTAAERAGFEVTCTIRDYDDFGRAGEQAEQLTEFIFAAIHEADVILLDITDKGVGLGIEAGYAVAQNKPVVILVTDNADIPRTLQEIARHILEYQGFDDLTHQLSGLKAQLDS